MKERTFQYPAKDYLRGQFAQFVPPGPGFGLYLPGPENLELPLYVARGYRPADLIGAEHSAANIAEVTRNAQGVRVMHGEIRDVVATIERERLPRLRIASLDFDGSYDTDITALLSVARVFPAEPDGHLMVTSYAARDQDAVRQGVIAASKFYSALGDLDRFQRGFDRMLRRYGHLQRHLSNAVATDQSHLCRELGFLWWMVLFMGFTRLDGAYGTLDEDGIAEVNRVLARISDKVVAQRRGTQFVRVRAPELREILSGRHCQMWPTDFRHFAYASRMNQPMRTWFFRICPMVDDPPTVLEVVEQMWELAVRAPLTLVDPHGDPITFG